MARERSPNYPAIGLSAAVEALKAFYDKEKRTSVPNAVAAKAIGYGGLSGPARVKLAALKKYSLVEGNDRSGLRISELGMHILFPASGNDEDESRRKAALQPELFRDLYDNYSQASDEALTSYLITRLHFAPVGARQVIAAFRDTISFAGLEKSDYNASNMSRRTEATQQPDAVSDFFTASRPSTEKTYSWPLSKDITAEVRFKGGEISAEQIDRLTAYLTLVKAALSHS